MRKEEDILASIETGFIKNKLDSKLYPYKIERLNKDHLAQVVEFHNEVIDALVDPDLCWRFPVEYIERYLGDQAITVGVFVEKRLIGFRVLYFPGLEPENPGFDIGLDHSEMGKVAHLPLSNVHPDFTGSSLQKHMTAHVVRIAKKTREFRYLCSNVSPKNYASMNEKFAFGMWVTELKIKYGKFLRYIFCKDILNDSPLSTENAIFVPTQDYSRQTELLQQGYYGFQSSKVQNKKGVLFGKKGGC